MKDILNNFKFKPVFVAVAAACAAAAQAQVVTTESLEAKAFYKLGADTGVSLGQTSTFSVDVVDFPSSGVNGAVVHDYGSQNGTFGSRSSGYGTYDVSGSFRLVQTITNNTSSAQNVKFNFYITPGMLQNEVNSVLTGSQFVNSGISFDIQRNGASVWGSSATLATSTSGTSFNKAGFDLYSNIPSNPGYYAIQGGNQTADLGVLNAGQSLTLGYDLRTFASGNAPAGADLLVPEQTFVVPEQYVDFCGVECGYGYGGNYGELIPGHTVIIPARTIPGAPSGSHANSGDPFDYVFSQDSTPDFNQNATLPNGVNQPYSVSFTAAVPEPSTYALMLAGLGVVGFLARKRRRHEN
jgi:hypothetical protein